jgi:aminoglycoside phosphotransferase (APT) family kinase protein
MSVLWKRSIGSLRRRAASLKKQSGTTGRLKADIAEEDESARMDVNGTHVPAVTSTIFDGIHTSIDLVNPGTTSVAFNAPHNAAAEAAPVQREEAVRRDNEARVTPILHQARDSEEYWGPVRDLREDSLEALLQRVTSQDLPFKLINRLNGAFNVAYIVQGADGRKVCVRVPACGWTERWTKLDADLLRATALGMKYIEKTSDLPIPRILSYDITMNNEIGAPHTIMTFLEGISLSVLWEQQDEGLEVLEARRQNILQSLARIMCTLATTTFRTAGTLWFPGDDDSGPVVGRSYRLDKRNIFMLRHEFLIFEAKNSLAEQLLEGRDERFAAEGFPDRCATNVERGVLALWGLMVDAFLQSATLDEGLPEFVLMQSDFNPQNILADEQGNVTGIIDWDCLESIPRQIGWCAVPHWLQADWYPDWKWPPDLGTARTASPDDFERYRNDYARYMREACPREVDVRFTSKSHIYQALLDSTEHFEKVENLVYNIMADILPRNSYPRGHLGSIGEYGFRQGEREWFESRLLRYFAPETISVR